MTRDDTHMFFRSSNWILASRILTGQFPNWEGASHCNCDIGPHNK